jgi:hypothetical protein
MPKVDLLALTTDENDSTATLKASIAVGFRSGG